MVAVNAIVFNKQGVCMYLVEPIRNGEYIYDGAVALAIQVHVLNKLNLDVILGEELCF